jgi:crossover junction endodeoxyribonuclease RuvC
VRILGIDPGSRHTGWGIVDARGSRLRALAWGRISPSARAPVATRLAELARGLLEVVQREQPDAAAVEEPYHGINPRSLIVLAEARGALLAVLGGLGIPIAEYPPATVKSAVTGSGRAEKEQVARMVHLLAGVPRQPPLPLDASDALAVAICHAHRQRLDGLARD